MLRLNAELEKLSVDHLAGDGGESPIEVPSFPPPQLQVSAAAVFFSFLGSLQLFFQVPRV